MPQFPNEAGSVITTDEEVCTLVMIPILVPTRSSLYRLHYIEHYTEVDRHGIYKDTHWKFGFQQCGTPTRESWRWLGSAQLSCLERKQVAAMMNINVLKASRIDNRDTKRHV
jgi:hypothetical protein